ncbi:MAG: hypothetical protein M3P47_03295 [Pseudomonadota bacterium]|nr:hypothetical protein [Pseudomonadota bacterium]
MLPTGVKSPREELQGLWHLARHGAHVVGVDITCIQTDEGWLYLAGLKGLSNRFLQSGEVGFGLSVQRCAHVADIFLYPFSTRYTFNH